MPSGGSCLLGSLNLSEFIINNQINYDDLEKATIQAVNALNEVLINGMLLHPLQEQIDSVNNWRQIGLGTMGLADMLIKLGITYGSENSLKIINEVYSTIAKTAIKASLQLAKIQGCYPMCNKEKLATSAFIKTLELPTTIIDDIRNYGLFNSQLLTCAPTGSIGTMLQISTGVEPIFAMKYTRRTVSLENKETFFDVYTKIAQDWLDKNPGKSLPKYFVESKDITPKQRVQVQGTLQKWIDASISSTTNLPKEATVEDVATIYIEAWKHGLKGITVYRAGCAREGILTTETPKKPIKEDNIKDSSPIFNTITPISRKKIGDTYGSTTCKKCACGTLYITCNNDKDGNLIEIFTHTSKGGICQANLNAETRMASLALRSGVKVEEVIDQLKGIACPACTAVKAKGGKVDGISCADIIAKAIESFNKKNNKTSIQDNSIKQEEYLECPECHEKTLIHEGGCIQCTSCGYSRCE